jgi:hypothetical protein
MKSFPRFSKDSDWIIETGKCPTCGHVNRVHVSPHYHRNLKIRSLYLAKEATLEELSKMFLLGGARLRQIIGWENIHTCDKKIRDYSSHQKRNKDIYSDYVQGYKKADLARKYHLSRSRIDQIVGRIEYRIKRGYEGY